MSTLVEKIRKARERQVSVGGFDFTIRRPTDMEMLDVSRSKQPADFLRFVVGWDKVREIDLIPGGDPHPAPFDKDACSEWLADRADLFVPVVNAITDAYQLHKSALEDAEKN